MGKTPLDGGTRQSVVDPCAGLVVTGCADAPPPPVNSRLKLKCPSCPLPPGRPLRQQCLRLRFYVTSTCCHRHGRLTRLSLDSFFYFAKSNSPHPLVDLTFSFYLIYSHDIYLILSIHVTFILSYPSLHVHSPTFFIFLQRCCFIVMTSSRTKGTAIYS